MHRFSHLRILRPLGYLLLGLLLPLGFGIANAQTDSGTTETPAQEVIENYESEIVIRKDGRLNVTETITVRNTEGGQIKRGIYRYFPHPEFKVQSVKRNGNRTTYRTEFEDGRKRIEIWKKDVYIGRGTYTYQIQYVTNRQIEQQGSQAQLYWRLYWNVAGQGWSFPIEQVQANIELPPGIASNEVNLKGFVGETGEKSQSYEASLKQDGDTVDVVFVTTRSLQEKGGLSVIVKFPQEYIESPNQLRQLTHDNQTVFFSLLTIIATGLSYFSYRQAKRIARNRPIYLTPGDQSRVYSKFGRSGNANSEFVFWVRLACLGIILAIICFLLIWLADEQIPLTFPEVALIVFAGFLSLPLGSFLEHKISSLRPRLDPNENRPMKRMDAKRVKPYLNEREKRVAWKLGSIDLEGWYSPENPSAIHCRIYDLPKGRYKYKFCPTCQEYIVNVASEKVVRTKRFEYPTRLTIYRCFCCDYQSEEREKISRKKKTRLR